MALALAACSQGEQATATAEEPAAAATGEAPSDSTPLPEIQIVDRDRLLVGVDAAFPPFADLDSEGQLTGLDVDVLDALAEVGGFEYQFVPASWATIFSDLVSGRFDAVVGAVTPAEAPAQLVELTEPYFEVGQVAVVLSTDEEILQLGDLQRAVVGVQPLSWGEFAVSGDDAAVRVPAGNVRSYDTAEALIEALFADHVDAIITHHTVIESYLDVNPGDLRILGGEGREAWLASRSYHIAVPHGADRLLASLNDAINRLQADGKLAEVVHTWGFTPAFDQRPKFVPEPAADSLVAGVEKVDDWTVRFYLNRPDPFFDYKMAASSMAIHSPANLFEFDGGGELASNPVGTGAYLLDSWEPGQAITLTANPDYWGDPPLIKLAVLRTVRDPAERYALLKRGEVQLVDHLGAEALANLEERENKDIAVYPRVPINVAYLGMNRDLPPFDDRRVRQAVALCVDRADLVKEVYPAGTLAAHQFLPPNTFGFTPGLLWPQRDTDSAASLLKEAGLSSGVTVTLSAADLPTDFLPEPGRIAAAVGQQLAECGIAAEVRLLDADTFVARLAAGQLGFHLSGWSADFPGPISFLGYHFVGEANGLQFGAPYPEIVERLRDAEQIADRALRMSLYDQVNELLREKLVVVPLAHGASSLAARADTLHGIPTNPVRRESLTRIRPITDTTVITTLVYALSSAPLSLDPSDELDDTTYLVTNQLFDTLVDFEPATTELRAGLATEWSANEAGDVWEFSLRPGVRFQDGSQFNADAVILSFERLWDPAHPLHVGRSGEFRYFQAIFGGFRG